MPNHGKGGRPRLPEAIHEMRGTPPHYKADPNVVYLVPDDAVYIPPEHLDDIAKDWWAYHVPIFAKARVLTEADVSLLEIAAERWSAYRRAAGLVKQAQRGRNRFGEIVSTPQNALASKAIADYLSVAREFGVGPASRSKVIGAGGKSDEDEFEEMFG